MKDWKLEDLDLLIVENVGNLVCPSSYDLGEDAKIVLLSTTEGEDKPLKYPSIFFKSELMLLTKIDLLPYVPFRAEWRARTPAASIPDGDHRCLQHDRRRAGSVDAMAGGATGSASRRREVDLQAIMKKARDARGLFYCRIRAYRLLVAAVSPCCAVSRALLCCATTFLALSANCLAWGSRSSAFSTSGSLSA